MFSIVDQVISRCVGVWWSLLSVSVSLDLALLWSAWSALRSVVLTKPRPESSPLLGSTLSALVGFVDVTHLFLWPLSTIIHSWSAILKYNAVPPQVCVLWPHSPSTLTGSCLSFLILCMLIKSRYHVFFLLRAFNDCSDVGDETLCFLWGMRWALRCSSAGRARRCVSSEGRCSASHCLKAWAAGKRQRPLSHTVQRIRLVFDPDVMSFLEFHL